MAKWETAVEAEERIKKKMQKEKEKKAAEEKTGKEGSMSHIFKKIKRGDLNYEDGGVPKKKKSYFGKLKKACKK